MPRRNHTKSRKGCAECKRRHVKCDESRPSCVNCTVASLRCSYLKSSDLTVPVARPPAQTPSFSPLTPEPTSTPSARHDTVSDLSPSCDALNMDHLQLFHHYQTITYTSFTADGSVAVAYRNITTAEALRFPWLMAAILAVSALHLCSIHTERSAHYRSLASSLRATGLVGLKDNLLNINKDNCVALFVFSTTVGLHSFCETFNLRDHNFNIFLDKLTSTISLLRGVRQVINGEWWEYLKTTGLKELLAGGAALGNEVVDKDKETKPLWELLKVADIGPASAQIYEDTITSLQRVFTAESRLDDSKVSVSMVFAWPVMVSGDYNQLLQQRRPEALVILAFYAVVLHHRREAWAVADSGQFLFHAINEYLGQHWEHWLQWPKSIVMSTSTFTEVGLENCKS